MENQHRKIEGYRELNQIEIDLMNKVKSKGIELDELHQELMDVYEAGGKELIEPRWVAEGKTDLQKGLMCWVRSIAKPNSF